MKEHTFTFDSNDGLRIFVYAWYPATDVRGVIQISHGMAETAQRYRKFAQDITTHGYIVYANDHRGHGQTAQAVENLGYCGENGFAAMVRDMRQLEQQIRREHPTLPLFLLGHSMGSFLLQQYLLDYPDNDLTGAILSGSNGTTSLLKLTMGLAVAKHQRKKYGARTKSEPLNQLFFGRYGKRIALPRTSFDWLTRDESEVDRYIADPYCGFVCSTGFYYDFLQGLLTLSRSQRTLQIRKDFPLFIFSGQEDPVGIYGKGVLNLAKFYANYGLQDVVFRLYPGGRHEMLNETNRDEVIRDLAAWLDAHI